MKLTRFALVASLACTLLTALDVHAALDVGASVVKLRTSCQENGTTLGNCFTYLTTLNTWIWSTRNPSASAPLTVEIGAGTFQGQFTCSNRGYVSLRGAGMQNTTIENGASVIETTNCVNLVFSHMTLRNTSGVTATITLGGNTYWDNIEIDALGYAWIDSPAYACIAKGKHYWFSSRLISHSAYGFSTSAYYNACDESWFFGSEITAIGRSNTPSVTPVVAHGGEIHVYGSVIRAMTTASIITSVTAAKSLNNGMMHIHGTGIDVISTEANNIVALEASGTSEIHANESSYNLSTGAGGSAKRISKKDTGHIHAPYLWEHIPTVPNFSSVTGADMTVITNTSGNHPHLVVYDSGCPTKWFDTTANACM